MDKASDFGSEDCRFESCRGRYFGFTEELACCTYTFADIFIKKTCIHLLKCTLEHDLEILYDYGGFANEVSEPPLSH